MLVVSPIMTCGSLTEMLKKENEQFSKHGDTKSARAIMLVELKKLIEANPLFRDKLQFPNLTNSRLWTLINQSRHHRHGKWQARIGRVAGNKALVLLHDVGPTKHNMLSETQKLCSMLVEKKLIYSKYDEVEVIFGTEADMWNLLRSLSP